MQIKHSWMDNTHHAVYGDRWYSTWFFVVRTIFPLEVRSLKEWLRNP
jgi:hypothetical protein